MSESTNDLRLRSAAPATGTDASGVPPEVLALQGSAGNAAVATLIAGAQAKMRVGAAGDPFEREADDVARRVVASVRNSDMSALAAAVAPGDIQRKATGDGGVVAPGDEQAIQGAQGGGSPLPDTLRSGMEEAFGGADFSGVRVHTDDRSAQLNDAVQARAFTVGQDIFFGAGELSGDRGGQELLAHELTHVVQQGGGSGTIQRKETVEHTATGTTKTIENKDQNGVTSTAESSSDVFDGTTHKTSEAKAEGFKGAETASKTISKYSANEIEKAVELMARAGAFGEASAKAAIERGPLKAGAEGSAKGKAGAETTLNASVKVNADLYNALKAVVEGGAQAGVEGSLQGKLEAGLGPFSAAISAQLSAFAGAMAKFKATLDVGITHVYAEFEASAFAGAKVEGEAAVTVKLGPAEAKAAIEGSAMAGAQAEAKGVFKIDLTGVEITGKAEAFAGVKASAKGKTEFSLGGRKIFAASGEIGVRAGAGGEVEGGFEFRKGKLKLKGKLAAALGVGGDIGLELEVDFYELGLAIEHEIVSLFLEKKEEINRNSPAVERVPIIDPALATKKENEGYNAYLKDFEGYNSKKETQGNSGIKRERVQEILDKRWHANKDNWQFVEFDEGIMRAARTAFGPKLTTIIVQGGQLRAFEVTRTDAQKEHLANERKKAGLKF